MRFFFPSGPHPGFALAADAIPAYEENTTTVTGTSYENPLEDGFLWGAAPKHRRSREKRMTRKFGGDRGHKKMLPVLKLLTCDNCGHVHEPGRLCRM
ncbi:54S ribosomal protein L32, mitochondrial [Halocaridina rubra]|uniref:Large ribosomal subunit protein bL32m n=1 Tax=Halocaridina rubra TaxID=373956 RepID=A0AAN8ZT98_HALRR